MLVFVGVATLDAIAVVDSYPGADDRVAALDIVSSGGGPAATAAVAAARLGMPTALVSAVGDDEEGAAIVSGLEAEGVDVSSVERFPGARSARSLVTIGRSTDTRAIVNRPGPALSIEAGSRAGELVLGASWVHVDQHGWAPVRALLDADGIRTRLSVDAGNEIPGYRAAGTDLYAPTDRALANRYSKDPDDDIETLLRRARDDGARLVVATRGSRGAVALAETGEFIRAAVPEVPVVSTLGAGDVFHGALLAGLLRVESGEFSGLQQALAYATVVSSLSCRGVDGRSRIPDHAEALAVLESSGPTPGKASE